MTELISDYAQVEISNKIKDILRRNHSSSWHSKPYHQNQIPLNSNTIPLKLGPTPFLIKLVTCELLVALHVLCVLPTESHFF